MLPIHVARLACVFVALISMIAACEREALVGGFLPSMGGSNSEAGAAGEATTRCEVRACQNHIYACGDCVDNDGDNLVDAEDPDCFGPCHNLEDGFFGGIPGQTGGGCRQDCYFDQDSGSGNDQCEWDHTCDPLAVSPNFGPSGESCEYDAGTTIGAPPRSCDDARSEQSVECRASCGPLTPNGCDCFGCCNIPGAPTAVWLGSELDGAPSCNRDSLADPSRCRPCTQVGGCLNPCEECELCIGKRSLPDSCGDGGTQVCPAGAPPCSLGGQSPCPGGMYCVTGCCIELIK